MPECIEYKEIGSFGKYEWLRQSNGWNKNVQTINLTKQTKQIAVYWFERLYKSKQRAEWQLIKKNRIWKMLANFFGV